MSIGSKLSHKPQSDTNLLLRLKPTTINIEKEKLYEDNMALKLALNNMKSENLRIRTKVTSLEKEISKKDDLLEEISTQDKTPAHKYMFLVNNLKQSIKELRNELRNKETEVNDLKKNLKSSKITELEIEIQTYVDECTRLNRKIEEIVKNVQENSQSLEENKNYSDNFLQEKQDLITALNNAQEEINKYRSVYGEFDKKSKKKGGKGKNNAMKMEIQKLRIQIDGVLREKSEKEAEFNGEIGNLKNAIKELKQKLDAEERKYKEIFEKNKESNEKRNILKEKIDKLTKSLKKSEENYQKSQEKINSLEKLNNQLEIEKENIKKDLKKNIDHITEEKKRLEESLEKEKNERIKLEIEIKYLEKIQTEKKNKEKKQKVLEVSNEILGVEEPVVKRPENDKKLDTFSLNPNAKIKTSPNLQSESEKKLPKLVRVLKSILSFHNFTISDLFSKIDPTSQGYLEVDSFRKKLKNFGKKIKEKHLDGLISHHNNKSVVVIKNLLNFYQSFAQTPQDLSSPRPLLENSQKNSQVNNFFANATDKLIQISDVSHFLQHISLCMQLHRLEKSEISVTIFGKKFKAEKKITLKELISCFKSPPFMFIPSVKIDVFCEFLLQSPTNPGEKNSGTIKDVIFKLENLLPAWIVFDADEESSFDEILTEVISKNKKKIQKYCKGFDREKSEKIEVEDFRKAVADFPILLGDRIFQYLVLLFYSHEYKLNTVPYMHFIQAYGEVNVSDNEEKYDDEEKSEIVKAYLAEIASAIKKKKVNVRKVFQADKNLIYPESFIAGLEYLGLKNIEHEVIVMILQALQCEDENEACIEVSEFEKILENFGVVLSPRSLHENYQEKSSSHEDSDEEIKKFSLVDSDNYEYSDDSPEKHGISEISPFGSVSNPGLHKQKSIPVMKTLKNSKGKTEEFGKSEEDSRKTPRISKIEEKRNSVEKSDDSLKEILKVAEKNEEFSSFGSGLIEKINEKNNEREKEFLKDGNQEEHSKKSNSADEENEEDEREKKEDQYEYTNEEDKDSALFEEVKQIIEEYNSSNNSENDSIEKYATNEIDNYLATHKALLTSEKDLEKIEDSNKSEVKEEKPKKMSDLMKKNSQFFEITNEKPTFVKESPVLFDLSKAPSAESRNLVSISERNIERPAEIDYTEDPNHLNSSLKDSEVYSEDSIAEHFEIDENSEVF